MKLKYDELLSNFAFNCDLRHYTKGTASKLAFGVKAIADGESDLINA